MRKRKKRVRWICAIWEKKQEHRCKQQCKSCAIWWPNGK